MRLKPCIGSSQIIKNEVVGAARFELTTSASQTRRSTRLSYAPVHGGTLVDSRRRIKKFLNKNSLHPIFGDFIVKNRSYPTLISHLVDCALS
jgi:hypothetical protein